MSTKERYGSEVYQAVVRNTGVESDRPRALMTVGEVARWAGVAKPTAQKYLMVLVKLEVVATFPVGKRWVYQYVGDGRDI